VLLLNDGTISFTDDRLGYLTEDKL
jgi:hypothetical protein